MKKYINFFIHTYAFTNMKMSNIRYKIYRNLAYFALINTYNYSVLVLFVIKLVKI